MNDIYKNIEDNNPNKKRTILIVFDDMILDMLINKKLNLVLTELFIRCRKLKISLVFIMQSYFVVPKNIRLNSTHYFIMKFQTKENFNKLYLIIHQILTIKALQIFTKNIVQNHITFLSLLLLHQIILQVSEKIF